MKTFTCKTYVDAKRMVSRYCEKTGTQNETLFSKYNDDELLNRYLWVDVNNEKIAYYNPNSKIILFHKL